MKAIQDNYPAKFAHCYGCGPANPHGHKLRSHDELAPIRFVTASLKIDVKRPTPMGTELVRVGTLRSLEGRKAVIALTLSADGNACALGEMLAVQIPDGHG
ncbi:MAG: hypothetical protein LCH73_06715 [Proteobacteria bacterium]|nr:hypothetical protein [Pseudomonadota bacterium]